MMSTVRSAGSRLLGLVMAICLAAFLAVGITSLAAPGEAYAASNQKVLDQRAGVFKFNWGINGVEYARGSCFLINDDTIITAYHCVMPSSWELDKLGYSMQDVNDQSNYTITIEGDFQVGATLEKVSEKQDFAILKLDQRLNGKKALQMRDSKSVDASESVYSLGFPGVADQNAVITFTSNDVAVMDGTVTKPEGQMNYIDNTLSERSGVFIMTTCRIEGGTSGGPMVDANGNVIGVCVASDTSFYYAAASDVLMEALDTMNYKYTKATEADYPSETTGTTGTVESSSASASASSSSSSTAGSVEPLSKTKLDSAIKEAEAVTADKSKYTEDSYKAFETALADAKEAQDLELSASADDDERDELQTQINDAATALKNAQSNLAEQSGLPLAAIIGIIIAVVAVIVIIVLVIVMRGRKKKDEGQAPTVPLNTQGGAVPGTSPSGSQSWSKPAAAMPAAGGGDVSETTILDDNASDTVILFQAASGGSLTRMSTNEQIPINSAEFTIGRERSKVNYCLEGNSSISRVHVRIVVRDGNVYLIDNRAANGTFVNGVKARPGEEIQLKSGDIITLADEKFKYNA